MDIREKIDLWGEDIPWLEGLREKGRRAFNNQSWPNAKNESWKYSYFSEEILNHIKKDKSVCNCEHGHGDCVCRKNDLPFVAYNINFCNGKVHVHAEDFPRGITVKTLVEAIYDGDAQKYLGKSFEVEKFPFAAMNTAYIEQGIMLIAEKNTQPDKPIYIRYTHENMQSFCAVRNIFVIEKNAALTVVEHTDCREDTLYFDNVVNEIYLHDNARLKHYRLQEQAKQAYNVYFNNVCCRGDSLYKSFAVQQECALTRHESRVLLQQKGARAEVNGIYKIKHEGVCDMTTNVRHLAANTYSDQLVKGVVDGKGKGVFQGQIHIAPSAKQTEGHQLHRALLLSNEGEVDCKPELEIFADDVQCSHGATCGDLDQEQLFYMRSRGIAEADAKKMLIEAHIMGVVTQIDDEDIRKWIIDKLSFEL